MVLNVIEFEMPLAEAMKAPRLHHQWLPDRVTYETFADKISQETVNELRSMGHRVATRSSQGDAHSIFVERAATGTTFLGVADRRRNGLAKGPSAK